MVCAGADRLNNDSLEMPDVVRKDHAAIRDGVVELPFIRPAHAADLVCADHIESVRAQQHRSERGDILVKVKKWGWQDAYVPVPACSRARRSASSTIASTSDLWS